MESDKMATKIDKRWLKSVADPDLVGFFEDPDFDAADYAKSFFEQREASHAAHRCVITEAMYSSRQAVVEVSSMKPTFPSRLSGRTIESRF